MQPLRGCKAVSERPHSAGRVVLEKLPFLLAAGAFAVVIELIPTSLTKAIQDVLHIPTIGIGAGPDCDGQVLVIHDILGLFDRFTPKFVKKYANLKDQALKIAYAQGLDVPLVWNSNGYDSLEVIRKLGGIVDIYLPDFKYASGRIGRLLSDAFSNFPIALDEASRRLFVGTRAPASLKVLDAATGQAVAELRIDSLPQSL